MVRTTPRKPPFLSGASVLPFATRQSVVDRLADRDFGRMRADDFGNGRRLRPAGAAYVCHRAACGCRPLPGLLGRASPARQGPPSFGGITAHSRDAGEARYETLGDAGSGSKTFGTSQPIRALRLRSCGTFRAADGGFYPCEKI